MAEGVQYAPQDASAGAPEGDLQRYNLQRYARQLVLPGFGLPAQERLRSARVLVVGAGGLGSAVLPALAAAGIGTLGIIDPDRVESSNLARQTLHDPSTVGQLKVDSAAARIAQLNPSTTIRAHAELLNSANALALFSEYDVVVDGSDNFPTRYLVDDAATLSGIPSVWGALHQYGGQAGVSWNERGPTYRHLFPVPPLPGSIPSCEEAGVLPTVCGVIGSVMASETIKLLTGVGTPLIGRVTSYDARSGRFRELEYARDPDASPVTELIDYDLFCGVPAPADHLPESQSSNQTSKGDAISMSNIDTPDAGLIDSASLAAALAGDQPVQLVDVREPWEAEIASIDGAVLIPLGELALRAGELDSDRATVVYCHAGMRSLRGRDILRSEGFGDVRSLDGGIADWSNTVDPSVPRY